MEKLHTNATVLIVPGLREHVAEHWQTLLHARLAKVRTVPPLEINSNRSFPLNFGMPDRYFYMEYTQKF